LVEKGQLLSKKETEPSSSIKKVNDAREIQSFLVKQFDTHPKKKRKWIVAIDENYFN